MVTALSGGDYVVAWRSSGQSALEGRLYDAAGVPMGGEFKVASVAGADPEIAALANGGFVAVWTSGSSNGNGSSSEVVQAQRFDREGHTVGDVLQTKNNGGWRQYQGNVTALADGGFMVTWVYSYFDTSYYEGWRCQISGQRYDASGAKVGGEKIIGDLGPVRIDMGWPSIAGLDDGGYVVVWHRQSAAYTNYDVVGQRFRADGTMAGGQFQVNSYATGTQSAPRVTTTADGGFVVTWHSEGKDGSGFGVSAQRFTSDAVKLGGEFQVNVDTTGNQHYPSIATRSDGGFVVAWEDVGDIASRVYDTQVASGADVFDINAGDGAVTLFNTGHGSDGDVVRFDADKSDLWFFRSGNDLTVSVIGTSDTVSVSGWYSDGANRVSTFQDGQGETLSSGSVDALVYAMSAFAPPAAGQLDMTSEQHLVLDPIIAANWS